MENEPEPPEIDVGFAGLAGVWANSTSVAHTEDEFMLDFVRLDITRRDTGSSWRR